jgi:hypothetical protein
MFVSVVLVLLFHCLSGQSKKDRQKNSKTKSTDNKMVKRKKTQQNGERKKDRQ